MELTSCYDLWFHDCQSLSENCLWHWHIGLNIEANGWTWGLCHSLCSQDLSPQGEWVFELRAGVMGGIWAGAGRKMGSIPVNDWQRLLGEVTKMHRTVGKPVLWGHFCTRMFIVLFAVSKKLEPIPRSTHWWMIKFWNIQQWILKQQKGTNYWYFIKDEFQNNYAMWKKPEHTVLILWKECRLMYSDRRLSCAA